MRLARFASLLLLLFALPLLAGCDYSSYRATYALEANSMARASVSGRRPSMRITNQGPGAVTVQFLADRYPVGEARRLEAGDVTTEALGGDFSASLKSATEPAQIIVEVELARRLIIDPKKGN